ncbi:DUF1080 domain-containing protein [bacterium]|nr:DUF1080 domain-containing protein [bacterium]
MNSPQSGAAVPAFNRRKFLTQITTAGAGLALAGCSTYKSKKTADNWIQLYNGRNLDGWIPKIRYHKMGDNFGDTFRIVDGYITVSYEAYKTFDERYGHLFYHQPFSHYRLRAEYRFIGDQCPGGAGWAFRNNGLMLHGQTPESMTVDQDYPVSIEAQLLGGDGVHPRHNLNVCTPGTNIVMNGKLHTQHCTDSTSKTYHGDQWVTAEVEVHGNDYIRHIMEGVEVLRYEKPQLDPKDGNAKRLLAMGQPLMLSGGTISVQSESHPTQFRKIEVLPLDA